eukprot:COSAG02_NODE_52435_length_308_cov_0.421053_1_plen_59_part_10
MGEIRSKTREGAGITWRVKVIVLVCAAIASVTCAGAGAPLAPLYCPKFRLKWPNFLYKS